MRLIAGDNRQVITKTRARQHELAMVRWGSDYMDPHSNAQTFCMNQDNSDNSASNPAMTGSVVVVDTLAW